LAKERVELEVRRAGESVKSE